jgi:hypothetical protein
MPGHRFHQPDHRGCVGLFPNHRSRDLGIIIVNKHLTRPRFVREATTGCRPWPGVADVGPGPNVRSRAYGDRRSFTRRRAWRKQPTSNIAPAWRLARRNLLVNRCFRV